MMDDYNQRREFDPPAPEPPTYFWWIFVLVVLGIVMLSIGIARADEPRPYVITIYLAGKDYDENRRTHFVLGDPPVVYESRETCLVAITRVRVELKAARLQCNPHR